MYKQNTLPSSEYPSGEPPYAPKKWNDVNKPQVKASHNCYTYMLNDLHKIPRKTGKPQPGFFAYRTKGEEFNKMLILGNNRLSCNQVKLGVKADNTKAIKIISCEKGRRYRCKPGYYKGFLMMAPDRDYHFARQDNRMIDVYRAMNKDKIIIPEDESKAYRLFLRYIHKVIPEIVKLARKTYPYKMYKGSPIVKLRTIYKCSKTWSHKPGATSTLHTDADGKLILNPEKANWDFSKTGGINYSVNCCYFDIPSNFTKSTHSSGIGNVVNSHLDTRRDLSVNHVDHFYEKHLISIIYPRNVM